MENQETNNVSILQIINGGVEINVTHLDGTVERIKVRQLPLRQLSNYGDALSDETKLCQLLTSKDAEWIESIDLASQDEIITVGSQLNDSFFLRWADRRIAAAEKVNPRMARLVSVKSASPSSSAPATPLQS